MHPWPASGREVQRHPILALADSAGELVHTCALPSGPVTTSTGCRRKSKCSCRALGLHSTMFLRNVARLLACAREASGSICCCHRAVAFVHAWRVHASQTTHAEAGVARLTHSLRVCCVCRLSEDVLEPPPDAVNAGTCLAALAGRWHLHVEVHVRAGDAQDLSQFLRRAGCLQCMINV